MDNEKDPAIVDVLDRLRSQFGPKAFVIADHWEADLCSVGIASPRNLSVLAYITSYGDQIDRFGFELEMPTSSDGLPRVVVEGAGVSFEELARVIAEHLKCDNAGGEVVVTKK